MSDKKKSDADVEKEEKKKLDGLIDAGKEHEKQEIIKKKNEEIE